MWKPMNSIQEVHVAETLVEHATLVHFGHQK